MVWHVEIEAGAEKDLRKLDQHVSKRILSYLKTRVAAADDPRSLGKALTGALAGYWRYRVGDYRILCEISDSEVRVVVVRIRHRREVYQ